MRARFSHSIGPAVAQSRGAYFGLGTHHGSAARWPMRLSQFFFCLSPLFITVQCSWCKSAAPAGEGEKSSEKWRLCRQNLVQLYQLQDLTFEWRTNGAFFGPFGGEWRYTALEIDIRIRNSHFHISLNTRRCLWGNSSACIQIISY